MKNKHYFWAISLLLLACQSNPPAENNTEAPVASDNSRISLDWAGTYRGTLPCADCPGIKTEITLLADGSYRLGSFYQERSQVAKRDSGSFSWNADGNRILLNNDSSWQFLVGENRLFKLDLSGARISGALADAYALSRVTADTNVAGRFWRLVALRGSPLPANKSGKEAHLLFGTDGRVSGNAGCNSLMGSYERSAGNRLRFGALATTEMFCAEGMQTESEFLKVLSSTDNFSLAPTGDTLYLQRARMAPMAVLVEEFLR
jgi:heat shock protein HslJ